LAEIRSKSGGQDLIACNEFVLLVRDLKPAMA
jgi:hypothetical protein